MTLLSRRGRQPHNGCAVRVPAGVAEQRTHQQKACTPSDQGEHHQRGDQKAPPQHDAGVFHGHADAGDGGVERVDVASQTG